MKNHLHTQTSPYLLQHAENPVDWYPWCKDAFDRAQAEDKPIFLSIGYSTCHWCHVMAHESFEDEEIAQLLNRHFICIKVDREERPDIDSIYMTVCQAFTGSGGWPTSIFMTAQQKPFFAGTYFPKSARYGTIGLKELLLAIHHQWEDDRERLLRSADAVLAQLRQADTPPDSSADPDLIDAALKQYGQQFDPQFGGFGAAPKFPAPHNLLFLLRCFQTFGDTHALEMAEKTLSQMYFGGLFDHIGYGFCRYSTDQRFLVPHFEKMLYDNALLMLAYSAAYAVTQKSLYLDVAEQIAFYIMNEMTAPEGAFYSAQDADSAGQEGKYYLFTPEEVLRLLGEERGSAFNAHYGITPEGNFEGASIPNLLHNPAPTGEFTADLPQLRAYRRSRTHLSTDDKILTAWNGLMIAGLCQLYRISRKPEYLTAAVKAHTFLQLRLCDGDTLYVSYRAGQRGNRGFLEEYANVIFALLALYDATLEGDYLSRAEALTQHTIGAFFDEERGGFFLYSQSHEALILRPKETYDGAMPSGNSVMTANLVRLCHLTGNQAFQTVLEKQLSFMSGEARRYPSGYAMFLTALTDYHQPPQLVTVVLRDGNGRDALKQLPFLAPLGSLITVLPAPTPEYPLVNQETTYYICRGNHCLPPTNDMTQIQPSPSRP